MPSCCRCIVGLAASKRGGVQFLCTFRPAVDTLRSSAEERAFTGTHSRQRTRTSAMPSLLGTVVKQVKSHPALIPLFIFIGGGATMSVMYLGRLALKNPDVSWDRKNNPEPWNKLETNQQYKLFTVNMDYSKLKKDRPDF